MQSGGYRGVCGSVVYGGAKSTASHSVKRDGDCWVAAVVTSFLTSVCPLQLIVTREQRWENVETAGLA